MADILMYYLGFNEKGLIVVREESRSSGASYLLDRLNFFLDKDKAKKVADAMNAAMAKELTTL